MEDIGDIGGSDNDNAPLPIDPATGLCTTMGFHNDFTELLEPNDGCPMTAASDGNKFCVFLWKMLNSCESGSIGGDACRQFDVLNSALDDALMAMNSMKGKFEHLLGWTAAAANHGLHSLLYRGDPDRNRLLFKAVADGWKKVFEKTSNGSAAAAVGVSEALRSFAIQMCDSFQQLLKEARKEYGDYARYTFNYIKKPRLPKGPSLLAAVGGGANVGAKSNSVLATSASVAAAAAASSAPGSITIVITKTSKDMKLGIVLKQDKGVVKVISIAADSVLASTGLKVGMTLESINGMKCTSLTFSIALFKAVEGQVTIVANSGAATSASAATTAASSSLTTSSASIASTAAVRISNQKENSVPAKNVYPEEDNDDEPKPWESEDFVPMRGAKQKTPNMIRNELQKYIDQCKADGSMTQTRIIEKMGVNNNTFRRFMNPKTYKDQWSATQNGTYWAAARMLTEVKYNQDKAKKSGAKRKATSGTSDSAKKANTGGLSNSSTDTASSKMSKNEALAFFDRINAVEEVPEDQVYDTCPQLVAKIKSFVQRPGMTKANLLRAMGNINSNSLNRFLTGKGQDQCSNVTYKAGYVFFEKLRILEGGKKTNARVKNECEHPEGYSLQRANRGRYIYCVPGGF